MAANNDIVLFHYSYSPYARKITWYLALRGIPYSQCIQPPLLPRPDLTALGIHYRRIPILAIGRSIYCDTRLIISKLDHHFPHHRKLSHPPSSPQQQLSHPPTAPPPLLPTTTTLTPAQTAMTKLLQHWCMDSGVIGRAIQLIPTDLPLMRDARFTADRREMSGRSWAVEDVERGRGEALAYVRTAFEELEGGVLGDGREWVLGTEGGVTGGDIEAIFPFHWLVGMEGALPPEWFSPQRYPKVYAWIDRFSRAVADAKATAPRPTTLQGGDAVRRILNADLAEGEGEVEPDPLGLVKGQEVESWPIDSGSRHRDRGVLVALNAREVVLGVRVGEGVEVRIHHPRVNYRVRAVGDARL